MEDIQLTPDQEQKIISTWNNTPENPPSLKVLTELIFGEGFDGRSFQARAIKKFLSTRNLKAKTTTEYESKTEKIELSDAHKQYIQNNLVSMSSVEMARILFSNPSINNLNAETRAVHEYMRSLNVQGIFNREAEEDIPKTSYEPPKTFDQALKRINNYVTYADDRSKITPTQKKNVEMLMSYLHTYRFIAQMNNYENLSERRLCEDAFIRATYDKPDLAQEEIDQYIEYANQVVQGFNIQRRSNRLQAALENIAGNEPETMKISMGLVESIGKASTEYHQCKQREQKLLDDLKEKRSVKVAKSLQENASILNLIQAWKEEESRKELIAHAEKEQKAIANEVNRLSSLPELKARILGLPKEEILNG